jgi:hypothetical protein
MNETENKKQSENPSSHSVSTLATISFWCAIIGWGFFAAGIPLVLLVNYLDQTGKSIGIQLIISLLIPLAIGWISLNLIAFISGTVILFKIIFKRIFLSEVNKAITGTSLSFLVIVPIFLFVLYIRYIAGLMVCANNMRGVGNGILLYAADYKDKYPTPEKWCDLLIEKGDLNRKQFVCTECRRKGNSICSNYAINPNCNINCPNDVVLLFETKAGWNQHGGPELLTLDNHNGKGTNILFNGDIVKYIKKEDVGKLKWKADEPNSIQTRQD